MNQPGKTPARTWPAVDAGDYVEFWPAGTTAKGRFRCTACGNEINARFVLPRCMLCGERLWERPEPSRAG